MTRIGGLAIVACILFAGCVGFISEGDTTQESTVTPVPVTDKIKGDSPPGIVGTTINREQLKAAHRDFLRNRSFTRTKTWVMRNQTGFVFGSNSTTKVVGESRWWHQTTAHPTPEYFTARGIEISDPSEMYYDVNQTVFYNDSTRYDRGRNLTTGRFGTTIATDNPLDLVNHSAERAVRYLPKSVDQVSRVQVNGSTVYRLTAVSKDPPSDLDYIGLERRYRLTAYISGDGFVKTVAVSMKIQYGDQTRYHNIRIDYQEIGSTTIETPTWVDREPSNHTTNDQPPY